MDRFCENDLVIKKSVEELNNLLLLAVDIERESPTPSNIKNLNFVYLSLICSFNRTAKIYGLVMQIALITMLLTMFMKYLGLVPNVWCNVILVITIIAMFLGHSINRHCKQRIDMLVGDLALRIT